MDAVRLDWRKTTPSPAQQADRTPAAGPMATPMTARTSRETGASTAAFAAPAPRRESPAPVLTMDRSTLDRLADNVMHRIERRVRIERERRGL